MARFPLWLMMALAMAALACSDDTVLDSVPADELDAGGAEDVESEEEEPAPSVPDGWDVPEPDAPEQQDAGVDSQEDPSTWPDEPLAPQNQWGPAGRVLRLEVPATPDDARHAGCFVVGSKVGTGLHSLLVLAGGLGQYLEPNAQGLVELAIFMRALGWQPGERAESLESVDLEVLFGDPDSSAGWLIAPSSFVEGDEEGVVRLRYPGSSVDQGWLLSTPGDFELLLTVLGLPIQLKFSDVRFSGRLYAHDSGFGMRDGLMTGYISEEDGAGLVQGILDRCMEEDAPDLCGSVLNLLGTPETQEELLEVVQSFIGEFDTHLGTSGPTDCGAGTDLSCNALSVCLVMDLDGVLLEGLAP